MERQNNLFLPAVRRHAAVAVALGLMLLSACSGPPKPIGPQMPDGLSDAEVNSAEAMAIDVRGLSQERATALIAAAQAAAAAPDDVDAAIWHGRQLAYCGRFEDAVRVYTAAADRLEARLARLRIAPEALPRLQAQDGLHRILRHRGHRFITLRSFALAAADLERAAMLAELVPDRVEPDGLPNAAGVPRSTSHTNIQYHLGLAHLLLGNIPQAREAWRRCLGFSTNDDMLVAAAWWLFCCELRLGNREAAADLLGSIRPEMDVIENQSYHRLLLWVKGDLALEDLGVTGPAADTAPDNEIATLAGGIGLREFAIGEQLTARRWFRLARNRSVNAFGAIVAETELARMGFGP
jgi:TolA-binding protein